MIKRLLLLLCLALTAGSAAWAEIAHGDCKNGTWVIDDDGLLTVDINGKMYDYGEGKAPWYDYRDQITAILISSKCTNIGRNAFYGLKNVKSVRGGLNVQACAMYSFQECGTDIPYIYLPSCGYVGECAFTGCDVRAISLPWVKTWKVAAISGWYSQSWNMSQNNIASGFSHCEFVDLGRYTEKLRPGSLMGVDYVFCQNPTPPEWERLYDRDEWEYAGYWFSKIVTFGGAGSYQGREYEYPFGDNPDVKFLVPQEYLQTYKDFYPKNHPEVQEGYMCAYYTGEHSKKGETLPTGKLYAGGPIYDDGMLVGGWYLDGTEIHAKYIVNTLPRDNQGTVAWRSVLGQATTLCIEYYGDEFIVPEYGLKPMNDQDNHIHGIKRIKFKGMNSLVFEKGAFVGAPDVEIVEAVNDRSSSRMPLKVGAYAFSWASKLTRLGGFDITELGESAFYECTRFVNNNDIGYSTFSMKNVPELAFFNCQNLDELDLSKVRTIGKKAFAGSSLDEVDLSSATSVGEEAFSGSSINKIVFGPSTKGATFSPKCFAECTRLKDIDVSSPLTSDITANTFDGVTLSGITLNVGPKLYGDYYENHPIFGQMKANKLIDWPVGSPEEGWEITRGQNDEDCMLKIYRSFDNFKSEENQPWHNFREFVKLVNVLSGIKNIGSHEFSNLPNVTSVLLPSSIKGIGSFAFKKCPKLKKIRITGFKTQTGKAMAHPLAQENSQITGVETLGDNVFEGCSALEYIDLGTGLKKAGDYIFKDCISLEAIGNKDGIPAEVSKYTFADIGSQAYQLRGGRRMAASGQAAVTLEVPDEFVTNYIIDPNWGKFHIKFADSRGTWEHAGPFGDGTWILYDDSTMVISADKGPGDGADNWKWSELRLTSEVAKKTKRIEFSGNIPYLCSCFMGFENLQTVSLCPSIKTLESSCFYGCAKLSDINLDNVETIEENALSATGLTAIDLSNVKSVGKWAFSNCPNLTVAKLGSQCAVGKLVFQYCSKLTAVDLGNANLDNANGCFSGCTSLKAVKYNGKNLPKGIFSGCTALKKVMLGKRARSIEWSAFKGCTALDTIYCDSPLPPVLPVEKNQDVIGYEGTGDVQIPILGPEYDVWAFYDLDRPSIKLFVHPDCVPVYRRFDVWKEMDIQGNAEDVEPLLPTGGSLRGSGKDENGAPVISGSTWYLDEEGKMTFDALGNIAARTSDGNYWWSVFDSYLPFIATVEVTDDVTGVPNNMFGWMDSDRLTRGITTVILGEGLKKAGYDAFHFSGIKDVYIYSENILDLHGNTFNQDAAVANNATLHVLKDPEDKYLNYYRLDNATKRFPNIVADLDPRHPKVQAVNFDISEVTLHPGEQLQLDPRFTPENVENKTLRYEDVSNGHHVYIDSENNIIFAQSEGVAYIEAFSSYTVSGEEVMALWGPTQEIYLKVTVTAPEPGEEIFFDYREGEATDAPTISCHVLKNEQIDVDHWLQTCEIAGPYNEDDILTQAIPEWRTGTVNIPEEAMGYDVVRVGAFAFYERQISTLYIPWTVTQIGYNACAYCDYLTDVYIYSFKPLRLTDSYGEEDENLWNNDAFYRIGEGDDGEGFATLHVPAGSKAAWDVYPWNEWFRYIVEDAPIPDGIKSIDHSPLNIGHWFDLSGRKLGGKPTQAGIYIMNGRKVVIR